MENKRDYYISYSEFEWKMKIIIQDEKAESPKVKGSRFIGYIFKIEQHCDVEKRIHYVYQQHPQPSHVCYAWILHGKGERYFDDGEPRGSAGKPILQHLKGRELTNILAVSVRYFGGTKLGVGGLIRAYGSSIALVLELVETIDYIRFQRIRMQYNYHLSSMVQKVLTNHQEICKIIEQEFTAYITTTVEIPVQQAQTIKNKLNERCSGRIVFTLKQ